VTAYAFRARAFGSIPTSAESHVIHLNEELLTKRLLVLLAGVALGCVAQKAKPDFDALLGFEGPPNGNVPGGWGGGPEGTIFADDKVVHGGHRSARLERNAESPLEFSTITKSIPMDFTGSTITLRGYLRTEDVSGFVGLWMREDGERPGLAFDNMENQHVRGSTPWTEYTITLPFDRRGSNWSSES